MFVVLLGWALGGKWNDQRRDTCDVERRSFDSLVSELLALCDLLPNRIQPLFSSLQPHTTSQPPSMLMMSRMMRPEQVGVGISFGHAGHVPLLTLVLKVSIF